MYALVATDPDDHGIRFVLTAESEVAIQEAGLAFILVRLQERFEESLAPVRGVDEDGRALALDIDLLRSAHIPLADRFAKACEADAEYHEILWSLVGPESVNPGAEVSA